MRANLRADAVFQRRDDLPTRRVVFRIRAEYQRHIERQADGVALNLHIAFLHDVEQSDLNLSRQIRQFVDGEDAAIGARQQAVVNRHFARQLVSAPRRFDGIDVTNQIRDGDIGRRQLFHVAIIRREISNGRTVAEARDFVAAAPANRCIRVVVDLASGEVRHVRIEQRGQCPQDTAFGLAAESEENKIMARKQRVDDLRYHGIVIADDSREDRYVALFTQAGDQIVAQFVLYPSCAQSLFGKLAAAQITQRARNTHERNPHNRKLSSIIRRDAGCVFLEQSRISARVRCRPLFHAPAPRAAVWEGSLPDRPRRLRDVGPRSASRAISA